MDIHDILMGMEFIVAVKQTGRDLEIYCPYCGFKFGKVPIGGSIYTDLFNKADIPMKEHLKASKDCRDGRSSIKLKMLIKPTNLDFFRSIGIDVE